MSDYPTVDAFVRGDRYTITHVRLEVEAMQKQLEAQKKRIASLTKALADAPYHFELDQLRKQLKEERKEMSGYPNIDAVIEGRVSGESFNWPQLRHEVMGVMKQLTEQGKGLQVTNEEILDKSRRNIALQEQLKEQEQELNTRIELIWQLQTEKAELRKNLSGLCQPIVITDEMVRQSQVELKRSQTRNETLKGECIHYRVDRDRLQAELTLIMGCNQTQGGKIGELKQLLNNQASTIANLQRSVREGCFADDEKIEQLEEKQKTMVATRDEVIANKDEEIKELKRRNANQVFNCRSLREGKNRLREEIKQLSAELVETQKDASFLRVKELREEIKQLRETVADWEELLNEE